MDKPITIASKELIEKLYNDINGSGLPFFVIEYILKDIVRDVHSASAKQYSLDKSKYEDDKNRNEE